MSETTPRRGARFVTVGVVAVLVIATVVATVLLDDVAADQDRQLLRGRAAEAGLVMSGAIASVKPSLELLGADYAVDPGSHAAAALVNGLAGASKARS